MIKYYVKLCHRISNFLFLIIVFVTDVLLSNGIKKISANYLPSIFWQIWRGNWYYSTCICKLARSKHIVFFMFLEGRQITGIFLYNNLWTNGSLVLLTAPETTSANNRRFLYLLPMNDKNWISVSNLYTKNIQIQYFDKYQMNLKHLFT